MADIRIVGSKFMKISSERDPDFSGKLSMKTNIKIKDISRIKEVKDTLKISYEFEVDYGELGGVEIEGAIFVSSSPKTMKILQKLWKDKKFEGPEHIQIMNIIIQKASIRAFELEEELGLPIHIRLPMLSPKKE